MEHWKYEGNVSKKVDLKETSFLRKGLFIRKIGSIKEMFPRKWS